MTYRRDDSSRRTPRRSWFRQLKALCNPWRDSHRKCGQVTPVQDKLIARSAIDERDYRHAAFHVAGALFADPNDREALDLADELLRDSSDPLELTPLGEKNYAGTVALRAYFLAEMNQLPAAVKLLRQVIGAEPSKPFEYWALRWLDRPEALAQIPTVDVCGILVLVVSRFPKSSLGDSEKARSLLDPWLQTARKFLDQRSEDGTLLATTSLIVRRTGDFQAALKLADDAYRLAPSYIAATARAMAHDELNNTDAALAAYNDGLIYEPESPEILADMALLELRRGNLKEAMDDTLRGLCKKPDHRTLEPLNFYLRYRLHNDADALDRLRAYVQSHPGHAAQSWLASLRPYVETLPSTAEATLGILEQFLPKLRAQNSDKPSSARFTVSAIEAPSVRLAVSRALGHFGMTLSTTVERVGEPDPRLPCTHVTHLLWQYDGTEPHPALPAPPDSLRQQFAAIASLPYDLKVWARRAADLALRFTDQDIPQLLAVTVHPPHAPTPERECQWILQIQIVVALTILHRRHGPLADSPAEDGLRSMLFGPMDWTNIAAVIALMHHAVDADDAKVSERIGRLFLIRLKATPRPGHCCFAYPALWALCALPKIDAQTHETFVSMYNEYVQHP